MYAQQSELAGDCVVVAVVVVLLLLLQAVHCSHVSSAPAQGVMPAVCMLIGLQQVCSSRLLNSFLGG